MLPDRRLVIVTGKGGVGRSAVTAALAKARAGAGSRVLAMAVGSGEGLAAHLGLKGLGPVPRHTDDGVAACTVDPATALDEYARLRVKAMPSRVVGRIFGVLTQTVPGVRDVVVIGKCVYEATHRGWDSVILDGPPTGQIESLLLAPSVIEDLVPKGAVHEQAGSLRRTLADPSLTGIVVVTTPEELAFSEAATFSALARRSGLTPTLHLVINRVLSSPGFESVDPGPGPIADAARLHLALLSTQERLLTDVQAGTRLPFVFGAHRPSLVVDELVKGLTA